MPVRVIIPRINSSLRPLLDLQVNSHVGIGELWYIKIPSLITSLWHRGETLPVHPIPAMPPHDHIVQARTMSIKSLCSQKNLQYSHPLCSHVGLRRQAAHQANCLGSALPMVPLTKEFSPLKKQC